MKRWIWEQEDYPNFTYVSKRLESLIPKISLEHDVLDTIILMPLSTDLIDDMEPYRMRISKRGNLNQDSDILINQVRTLFTILHCLF